MADLRGLPQVPVEKTGDPGKLLAMYQRITRGIKVVVQPRYLDDQSKPDEGHFVWAYTITVENHGRETVTLMTRYWKITDANGKVQEVRGAGVIGEQPTLSPGDSFQYTSGCPLKTPSGIMVGAYQMQTSAGELFNVEIPAFSLDSPHERPTLN